MAIEKFIPEIWAKQFDKELEKDLVFYENCNHRYEGMAKQPGDTIKKTNPPRLPAMENAWHGKPARRTSKSGTPLSSTFVTSQNGSCESAGKFFLYIPQAHLSISLVNTHSTPSPREAAARSNPSLIPPTPAKRSIVLYVFILI